MMIRDPKPQSPVRGSAVAQSVLIAVGGGKGGVGKSFVSSNLAIFLANMGFQTTLVDLDLGAPNLHTCLGEEHPPKNFHDFLRGNIDRIEDAAKTTQFPKLKLISGGNDHSELADLSSEEYGRLMSAIHGINCDFTVLDLSAGTHVSTLDFFLMAERHLVVMTPDPTSIENAYRFMKAAFFRRIKRYEAQVGLKPLISELMAASAENNIRFPSDLMARILEREPAQGKQLMHLMNGLNFNLVLNQTRSNKDIQLGNSIQSVCRRYFGVRTHFLGHLENDNAAWHSLRKRRPLLLEYPQSPLYNGILAIARDLASPHLKKAVV